jgi:hypothetical protein
MKLGVKIFAVFVMIVLGITFLFFDNPPLIIDKSQIKTTSLIDYPSKFNYRQTVNDCGAFNTAAVVRALKKEEIDSQVFAEEIGWRLPNKYTLPWGLEEQLEENGIVIEKPNLKSLPDEEKILFLQQQLSQGKPIIILGETNGFEHYITIFGFDASKDEFYIYDSLHDKDDNADSPGNRTFSSEELLDFWRGGGMYGMYKWYVIVASILE